MRAYKLKKRLLIILMVALIMNMPIYSYDSALNEDIASVVPVVGNNNSQKYPPLSEEEDLELKRLIEDYIKDKNGDYSFHIIDPFTGQQTNINNMTLSSASIIKTFLIVEVYKQVRDGKITLEDKLTLKDDFKVYGSGILRKQPSGSKYQVKYLLELVITISDNVAANMLADYVGLKNINATAKEMGMKDTNFGHLIVPKEKIKYYYGRNTTNARDLATIMYLIYTNQCLGEEYDQKMIELFKRCKTNAKIPRLLPKTFEIAHKTGSLPKYEHDTGIVYNPDRDFIFASMSHDLKTNVEGQIAIATVAKMTYEYMAKKSEELKYIDLKIAEKHLIKDQMKYPIFSINGEDVIDSELLSGRGITVSIEGYDKKTGVINDISYNQVYLDFDTKKNISIIDEKDYTDKIIENHSKIKINEGKGDGLRFASDREKVFIYVEDLKNYGALYENIDGYSFLPYGGDVLKTNITAELLGKEIVSYNIMGSTYVPIGYFYISYYQYEADDVVNYTDHLRKSRAGETFVSLKEGESIGLATYFNKKYEVGGINLDVLVYDGLYIIDINEFSKIENSIVWDPLSRQVIIR